MSERPRDRGGAGAQLAVATVAFTACFYAWSLLGPLSPDLQDALDLSDFQTSAMVAVPVLLGSLMRIPLGWLTDRLGVPFVNGWYPPERQGFALGIYGMGMGGTVLAGLTAPRIVDRWGLSAPFWVAAALTAAMCGVFLVRARDAA